MINTDDVTHTPLTCAYLTVSNGSSVLTGVSSENSPISALSVFTQPGFPLSSLRERIFISNLVHLCIFWLIICFKTSSQIRGHQLSRQIVGSRIIQTGNIFYINETQCGCITALHRITKHFISSQPPPSIPDRLIQVRINVRKTVFLWLMIM